MHYTFLLRSFPLGSETFVINQIVEFINQGHDVEIISFYRGDGKFNSEVDKYNLLAKTKYIVDSRNNSSKLFSFMSRFVKVISRGYRPSVIKSLNFFKYKNLSFKLILPEICSGNKFSSEERIYIAHFGTTGVIANYLRELNVLNGKIVTIFHGYDMSNSELLKKYHVHYKQLFKYGDIFLPISNLWKNKLISLGADENKISVIRMGIKISDFDFQPNVYVGGKLNIVTVARITEKKGYKYSLLACKTLLENNIDFTYRIIGFGEQESQIENMISDLGLQNNVVIEGFKPHSEISEILNKSHVFLLPSITASNGDMEGVPVSLMEAMASGLQVVSTYHSGIPELIDNDMSGYLSHEKDSVDLAKSILNIISGKEGNLEMVQKARLKIMRNFDQSKECIKMNELLEQLL